MKCEKCGGEWTPPKNISVSLTNCPFCGAPILNVETASSYTEMDDLLKYLVSLYGAELYKNRQKLSNLIADFYRGDERLKRAYRRAILEDTLAQRVYDLSLKPLNEREAFCNQIISQFAETNFYSNEFGKQIVDSFISGLSLEIVAKKEIENGNYDRNPKNLSEKHQDWKTDFMSFLFNNGVLKKAKQGDVYAQNRLGHYYEIGQFVEQSYAEAAKWYQKAAEQGNADAQKKLGDYYYYGQDVYDQGVQRDYKEAVKWFRKAAEQNYVSAQFNLGVCYKNGQGVPQDYNEAVKWYRKAAEQGNASAQNNLGYCYEAGQGVFQDLEEAVKWYRKAAKQGNVTAQNNLNELKKKGLIK